MIITDSYRVPDPRVGQTRNCWRGGRWHGESPGKGSRSLTLQTRAIPVQAAKLFALLLI